MNQIIFFMISNNNVERWICAVEIETVLVNVLLGNCTNTNCLNSKY